MAKLRHVLVIVCYGMCACQSHPERRWVPWQHSHFCGQQVPSMASRQPWHSLLKTLKPEMSSFRNAILPRTLILQSHGLTQSQQANVGPVPLSRSSKDWETHILNLLGLGAGGGANSAYLKSRLSDALWCTCSGWLPSTPRALISSDAITPPYLGSPETLSDCWVWNLPVLWGGGHLLLWPTTRNKHWDRDLNHH